MKKGRNGREERKERREREAEQVNIISMFMRLRESHNQTCSWFYKQAPDQASFPGMRLVPDKTRPAIS